MLSYLPLSPTSSPILKLTIYTLSREERTPRRRSCSCTCRRRRRRRSPLLVINRTSFSPSLSLPPLSLPPFPLLFYTTVAFHHFSRFTPGMAIFLWLRRDESENGADQPTSLGRRKRSKGRRIFLGGISPSLLKCSAIEEWSSLEIQGGHEK